MLSTAQCRSLLVKSDCTDDEIDKIRDQLYALAETIVDVMKTSNMPEEFRHEKGSKHRHSLRLVRSENQ
jgi:hypothetical protein